MNLTFRPASREDLPALVAMLAHDQLGASREDATLPLDERYLDAFSRIAADSNNELVVVALSGGSGDLADTVVGMMQLTFIPYLTHKGAWRCLIEGVRVHSGYRGQGFGRRFFEWAIKRAEERRCTIVQLTSNKQRTEAIRFYESLGFAATHEGFKLALTSYPS